jgi:DNA-binding response OmpR family regulator
MPNKFLLIGQNINPVWLDCLKLALQQWGEVQIVAPLDIFHHNMQNYGLILIEANASADMELYIARVKGIAPGAKIVIFSAAPNWEEAKRVLLAGASDYIKQTLNEKKLRKEIEPLIDLLERPDSNH